MPKPPSFTLNPSRPRFYLLDGLRLIAALGVVFYHYTARDHPFWGDSPSETFQFISRFTVYGSLGVHLFFVISGFVILMSTQGRTVGEFVASRVSRLYPAYWAAVLSVVVLSTLVAPRLFPTPSPQDVLVNLTMTQTAFNVPHLDGVYWTLWVELLFYLLVGLLMTFRPGERAIVAFAFLWPLIGAIAQQSKSPFLTELLQPNFAPLFGAGMVLYLIHAYGHSLFRWLLFGFELCLATNISVNRWLEGTVERQTGLDLNPMWGTLAMVAIFAAVALVTVSPLRFLGGRWLGYAGALTYPLYLIHENWGWWVISWAHEITNKWATLGLAVLFSLVFAALIERFIERPIRPRLSLAVRGALGPLSRPQPSGKRAQRAASSSTSA